MIYAECCERGAKLCYKRKGKWYLEVEAAEVDHSDFDAIISFCPFCGKKLGESVPAQELTPEDKVYIIKSLIRRIGSLDPPKESP